MLAGLGNAAGAPAQRSVGRWRAVAADDPDRPLASDFALNLPQEINQMRVHPHGLVLAPVAQDGVDLVESGFVVAAVHLVGDGQILVGVDVMQRDRARFALGSGVLQGLATEEDEESGEAAAICCAAQTQRQLLRDFHGHVPTLVKRVSAPVRGRSRGQASFTTAATTSRRIMANALLTREGLTRD